MIGSSSRLPYLLAGAALLLSIGLAWAGRDSFTSVTPGEDAPAFEAHDLEGRPVELDDYRGRVVLLNVWATWCPPCREEMPSMQRLYDEYEDEDFEIVAVSVDAERGTSDTFGRAGGNVAAFVDSLDLTFQILHDPAAKIQRQYQMTGLPESFLIGRDGTIYRRVTGATEWDTPDHRELIDRLLEMDPPGSSPAADG